MTGPYPVLKIGIEPNSSEFEIAFLSNFKVLIFWQLIYCKKILELTILLSIRPVLISVDDPALKSHFGLMTCISCDIIWKLNDTYHSKLKFDCNYVTCNTSKGKNAHLPSPFETKPNKYMNTGLYSLLLDFKLNWIISCG